MADRTLFNEDLVLSSLTISNSTSSNAAGYVPKSVEIIPTNISTPQIVTGLVGLQSASSPNFPTLTTANNDVIVTTASGSGLVLAGASAVTLTTQPTSLDVDTTLNANSFGITNGANTVTLQSNAPGTLQVGGTCNATVYGITNGVNAVSLTCPTPNVLQVPSVLASGIVSATTCNVSSNIGFIGASGNGSLTISPNGAILYFNGVQIN